MSQPLPDPHDPAGSSDPMDAPASATGPGPAGIGGVPPEPAPPGGYQSAPSPEGGGLRATFRKLGEKLRGGSSRR